MKHLLCGLLLAIALPLAYAQDNQPDTLSLAHALQLAAQRSTALRAQDAAAHAAREMAVSAATLPDPVLKLGVGNMPIEGEEAFSLSDDSMTMRSIGVMQEFSSGDKRRARAARFASEASAAEATRQLRLSELQQQTAGAWLQLYYFQQMRALLLAQRREVALAVSAADLAYGNRQSAQTEVFAARSALAQLDDRLALLQIDTDNAGTQLARWIGGGAMRELAAPPDIHSAPVAHHTLATQLESHPDLAVMRAHEQTLLAEAELARQEKTSDWSVELMYGERSAPYTDMVSLNVSIPLQFNRQSRQNRELSAKLAMAEQMRADSDNMLLEHTAQTQQWLNSWQQQLTRLHSYDDSLIPLAEQQRTAAQTAYSSGQGSLNDAIEARQMVLDVKLERLRIEAEAAQLWARLNFLVPADSAQANLDNTTDLNNMPTRAIASGEPLEHSRLRLGLPGHSSERAYTRPVTELQP